MFVDDSQYGLPLPKEIVRTVIKLLASIFALAHIVATPTCVSRTDESTFVFNGAITTGIEIADFFTGSRETDVCIVYGHFAEKEEG